jgi:hypothetical protein
VSRGRRRLRKQTEGAARKLIQSCCASCPSSCGNRCVISPTLTHGGIRLATTRRFIPSSRLVATDPPQAIGCHCGVRQD